MFFLDWLLGILSLILVLCNMMVSFVFVFSERLSRKNYIRLAFVLGFLSSLFFWLILFFRDIWGTADISLYAFFIVIFFIVSSVVGGFAVLIGVYHKKLMSFSQSQLQKLMQKKVAEELEREEDK